MSSREKLSRDEPKISLWANRDTLQVAAWVRGDHGLGSGRQSSGRQRMFQACTRYECCAGRTVITLLHHCKSRAEIVSPRTASARANSRDRPGSHRSPRSACLVSCPGRGARRATPLPVNTCECHLKYWLGFKMWIRRARLNVYKRALMRYHLPSILGKRRRG